MSSLIWQAFHLVKPTLARDASLLLELLDLSFHDLLNSLVQELDHSLSSLSHLAFLGSIYQESLIEIKASRCL